MDPSEYYEYEDRAYVQPTLSRDEQLGFVDTLRDTINRNTARINTQTQKLGTNITPNYGGLTGANSYFRQRYQTTPVQAQMATLKATAQAKALNDLMTNYQNQAANRYQQAYRNAAAKAATTTTTADGGTDKKDTDESALDPRRDLENLPLNSDSAGIWTKNAEGYTIHRDVNGNIIFTDDPAYAKNASGYYTQKERVKNQAKAAAEESFLSNLTGTIASTSTFLPMTVAFPLALGLDAITSLNAGANSIPESYRK